MPLLDDPEGVWEDDICCSCDGSAVPGLAAMLTPRVCSACVECSTHRYRRERPGLGVGPSVSVGGVKGTALGLGSRIDAGTDSFSTFQPLSSKGAGTWQGAAEYAGSVDVDGNGDYYSCDRCGSHTIKCAGCDIGMAIVPDNPKDFTALYGYHGQASPSHYGSEASLLGGSSSLVTDTSTPLLCVLCNGEFERMPDLMHSATLLHHHNVTLHMYLPQADPSRRDYARLLTALFHGRFEVSPAELPIVKPGSNEAPPHIHIETYLPRAIAKGVYVDHPLKPGEVRILVSEFHSVLAQDKCDDLIGLARALVHML